MGAPLPPPAPESVFVRVVGRLGPLPDDLDVTAACAHVGMDGELVTEALVVGPDAAARLRRQLPAAVVPVREAEWVRQCILYAAGGDGADESMGSLAVRALRAPEDEWHLLSHPGAPSAPRLLACLARCFDRALNAPV